jgi:sarcosine oxidase gamma subunit
MREMLMDVAMTSDDDFDLAELAGWTPDGLEALLVQNALPSPAAPGTMAVDGAFRVLRITPLAAWVLMDAGNVPDWASSDAGVAVALGNSRLRIRLRGAAGELLARLVAVDVQTLAAGRFAATMVHGVPIVVFPAEAGFDLLVPRTFGASLQAWIADAAGMAAH